MTPGSTLPYPIPVSYTHLFRSTDGGKAFSRIRNQHGDNHDLWIAPEDPNRFIESSDGGAQITFDGGKSWSTEDNQPTGQFYRVAVDNDLSLIHI